jgi:hypothetical protein
MQAILGTPTCPYVTYAISSRYARKPRYTNNQVAHKPRYAYMPGYAPQAACKPRYADRPGMFVMGLAISKVTSTVSLRRRIASIIYVNCARRE